MAAVEPVGGGYVSHGAVAAVLLGAVRAVQMEVPRAP